MPVFKIQENSEVKLDVCFPFKNIEYFYIHMLHICILHIYLQGKQQSWALPLQVAVIRYLANSEKISEIADLKSSGIAVAYC
jgi:hypothetical protein